MDKKFNKQNLIGIIVLILIIAVAAYYLGASKKGPQAAYPSKNANGTQDSSRSAGVFDYAQAPSHIGEYASVRGKVLRVYQSKKGTTFLDYCSSYKGCPFSAVIFSSASGNFSDPSQYEGKEITVTGKISSYQGGAEIILDSPDQISQ